MPSLKLETCLLCPFPLVAVDLEHQHWVFYTAYFTALSRATHAKSMCLSILTARCS